MFRIIAAAALFGIPLAACGGTDDDRLGERVEAAADNRADALDNRADALEAQAARERASGERRADAIDAADLNVAGMTNAQKQAIVANEAAAVR